MNRLSVSNIPVLRITARSLSGWMVALAGVSLVLSGSPSLAEGNISDAIGKEVKALFKRCQQAVVKIRARDLHFDLSGTGFFIDPTGTLYTTYSIGGESDDIIVELGEGKYPARRLLADRRSGIAILKIDLPLTSFLKVSEMGVSEVATPVVAIGYPMDLAITPSFGFVAGFDREFLGRFFYTTHIRANLPVQRGLGGAPLLNMNGEVVGILISGLHGGAACYALPIQAAEKVRSDFVRFGEVRHGWVGLTVKDAGRSEAGSRAEITRLQPDTPAADSGILKGDMLLKVGEKAISSPEDVLDASFYLTGGDSVAIKVLRGGKTHEFTVEVGRRPPRPTLQANVSASPSPELPLNFRTELK